MTVSIKLFGAMYRMPQESLREAMDAFCKELSTEGHDVTWEHESDIPGGYMVSLFVNGEKKVAGLVIHE